MKLITEISNNLEYITEATENGKKSYFIEGKFMVSGVKNQNGRIYPKAVMEKAVNDFMPLIKEKRAVGELNHPSTPSINMDRVSHLITELNIQGNEVHGKAKILDTPMGKIVQTFLDEGMKPGVSSRGLGSLVKNREGILEVQNDFRIATVDIVNNPSGPGCYVNGIMEGAEWVYNEELGTYTQKLVSEHKTEMKKMSKRQLEENAVKLFDQFLKSLVRD